MDWYSGGCTDCFRVTKLYIATNMAEVFFLFDSQEGYNNGMIRIWNSFHPSRPASFAVSFRSHCKFSDDKINRISGPTLIYLQQSNDIVSFEICTNIDFCENSVHCGKSLRIDSNQLLLSLMNFVDKIRDMIDLFYKFYPHLIITSHSKW